MELTLDPRITLPVSLRHKTLNYIAAIYRMLRNANFSAFGGLGGEGSTSCESTMCPYLRNGV